MLKTLVPSRVAAHPLRAFARTLATPSVPSAPLGRDTTIEHNTISESNKLSKTLKKFWKTVGIENTDTHYELQLDGKPLRTPLGNKLAIPKERRQLAHLIQHEWASLASLTIQTHSLPLTSLASRAVDLETSAATGNSDNMSKVGKKEDIIEMLLRYLDTDTLLVFSPKHEFEGALREAQEEKYRPIIKEIEELLGAELTYLDSDRDGLRGNVQPTETRDKAREWLFNLNYWDLVALEKVTLHAKSLICGILVLRAKSHVGKNVEPRTLEEIAQAATLEVIYQTEKWGEVEDTHDVDYQDIRRNINSAAILAFTERE